MTLFILYNVLVDCKNKCLTASKVGNMRKKS